MSYEKSPKYPQEQSPPHNFHNLILVVCCVSFISTELSVIYFNYRSNESQELRTTEIVRALQELSTSHSRTKRDADNNNVKCPVCPGMMPPCIPIPPPCFFKKRAKTPTPQAPNGPKGDSSIEGEPEASNATELKGMNGLDEKRNETNVIAVPYKNIIPKYFLPKRISEFVIKNVSFDYHTFARHVTLDECVNINFYMYVLMDKDLHKDDLPYPISPAPYVRNDSLFYHAINTNKIIKYNVRAKNFSELSLPFGLTGNQSLYREQPQGISIHFHEDESGIWVILPLPNSNKTGVIHIDTNLMKINYIWEVNINHRETEGMFIKYGILYVIRPNKFNGMMVDTAIDLYTSKIIDVGFPIDLYYSDLIITGVRWTPGRDGLVLITVYYENRGCAFHYCKVIWHSTKH